MSLVKIRQNKPDVSKYFKMSKTVLFIFSFLIFAQHNEAAKILAWFPVPSISHQVVFRPLTQELARRGHEVTVITTDPIFPKGQTPNNFTEIDVHDISYAALRSIFMGKQAELAGDIVGQMTMIFEAMVQIADLQLNNTEVKNIVKGGEKYDLLLIEACAVAALALTHTFKVPVIQVSSLGAIPGQMEAYGAPSHPFLYPVSIRRRVFNMTTWEKIQEYRIIRNVDHMIGKYNPLTHEVLKKHFGEDLPTVEELGKNVDLLLLNENPVWSGNRPVPPTVVYIGGMHVPPQKELPQDLKTYLDSSKFGVIYISFGTNVDPTLLPSEKIQAFIKVFSKLPYDVLWKWNNDELPGRTKNIRISKWLPQSDLLKHPKIKLFITQGGLQSTDEAIAAGVPLIGFPMLGDQWYNVEHYVHHQVGLQMDIATFTEDQLENAIKTVIGDPSFRDNMVRLRNLINDQPMSPLARAVWWTEHVLRHGGARHLRSPAANMPWTEYYELELILTVLGAVVVSLLVVIMILSRISKSLKRTFKGDKVKDS